MTKKTTLKKLDSVKRVKTNKKFEKITLITAIDTYGFPLENTQGTTALDEILSILHKHLSEVTIVDYGNTTDLELIERREETNESR